MLVIMKEEGRRKKEEGRKTKETRISSKNRIKISGMRSPDFGKFKTINQQTISFILRYFS
ncbi:hypothetical protein [Microcoleus sp. bin38.metabat.b11b12b14.051]|uniref:hypothetical protein n=1 Tax=Microcoleus sp. bin38.metabat.b11b12b14.051 TaxID=2742709 RepID=UPI0025CF8E8F|nr:hypothetical protein [Microcoleus sp. bin38.metabat.b11b12b14.051]